MSATVSPESVLRTPAHSAQSNPAPHGATIDTWGPRGAVGSQWRALVPLRETVQRYLRRHCVDAHLAEDLAQETFLRAARSRTRIEDLECPCAWLLRIASNLAKDTAEKASRDRLVPGTDPCFAELPGPEPIPGEDESHAYFTVGEDRMSSAELGAILKRVWVQLPLKDQDVLGSYYFEGKTAREATMPYGTHPNLVKVWLFRARRRLQGLLLNGARIRA